MSKEQEEKQYVSLSIEETIENEDVVPVDEHKNNLFESKSDESDEEIIIQEDNKHVGFGSAKNSVLQNSPNKSSRDISSFSNN